MSTLEWLRGRLQRESAAEVDHPMASLAEARALLGQLPKDDPRKALAEAQNWLSSVAQTPGFPPALRAQVVALIEDQAAPALALAESETFAAVGGAVAGYATPGARKSAPEIDARRVRGLYDYACALAASQREFLGHVLPDGLEAETREQLARHAHAVARRMALRRVLRLSAERQDWVELDDCFARATALRSLRTAQPVGREATSVLREYLRAVLFELGAPESLNPRAIELLYRLSGRQAPDAQLVAEPTPRAAFAAFPGKGIGPRPVARASTGAKGARYLDLSACVEQLRAFAKDPGGAGARAADSSLLAEFSAAERKLVVAHAVSHWGANPPHRGQTRVHLSAPGRIAGGLAAATQALAPFPQGAWLADLSKLGPLAAAELSASTTKGDMRPPTPVKVVDASPKGLGLVVPRAAASWLRVGALVAVHVDTAVDWALGLARRIGAEGEQLRVGVEVIAAHPCALWLRVPDPDTERTWARSKSAADVAAGLVRAILPAADPRGLAPAQMLLDPGIAEGSEVFEVPLADRIQVIRVAKVLPGTPEFARVAFVLGDARPLPRWATPRGKGPASRAAT